MKKILILGGYGNVSRFLSPLILENTDTSIIIAGRNPDKANLFMEELAKKFDKGRITIEQADASNVMSLTKVFNKADFIVNSASTIINTGTIVKALLKTGKDYLDVLLSSGRKLAPLRKADKNFVSNNQCVITDGGFHPGVPLAMIKYAAQNFDELNKANVGSLLNIDWKSEKFSESTVNEFITEMKDHDTTAFVNSNWKKLGYSSTKQFDFGEPFGKKSCIPMNLEEIRFAPSYYKEITETGFYVAGFNWFADYFILPVLILGVNTLPLQYLKPLVKLFFRSLKKSSKPPHRAILQLLAEGKKDGAFRQYKLSISHSDGYALTAIPAAACIMQYLEGTIRKPGLHFQADIVEPKNFISTLKRLGCDIEVS